MMDKMILNLGTLLLILILGKNIASASRVTTDPEVFVQRSTRGELKCEYKLKGKVSSVTWKKGPNYEEAEEIIKFFMGWKTGPKYNKGYDLAADNSTLIIENVNEEDAGTWWCIVVVTDPWTDRGSTNVTVTVPPMPPTISQCPTGQSCEIKVDKDDTNYTVTCTASGSQQAVTLVLYQDNQKIDVDPQQRQNSEDPSTTETYLEIPVYLESDKDEFVIKCEAVGHHTLPEPEKRAQQLMTIQRRQNDPTMSKRKDENPEFGSVKIGIYAGVGAVVAIALIISIIIAAFVVSSRMQDSEKHDYENLPKGFRNGLCAKSPVYQSPVSAC